MSAPTLSERIQVADNDHLLRALQDSFTLLYAEARGAWPRTHEPDETEIDALLTSARTTVREAIGALDVAAMVMEGDSSSGPGWSWFVEHAHAADIIGIGAMNLRVRAAALAALGPATTAEERRGTIGSALRAVQKCVSAAERAVASAGELPHRTDFYAESIDVALETRRRFVTFHEHVAEAGPPAPDALPVRLRSIGNRIAELLGHAGELQMRCPDRALLARSHARIRAYLLAPSSEETRENGHRLWQDLLAASTMLLGVHNREELARHDLRVAQTALTTLDLAPPDDTGTLAVVVEDLRKIKGRSQTLDALLRRPAADLQADDLRAALEGIVRELARGADAVGPRANPESGVRALLSAAAS